LIFLVGSLSFISAVPPVQSTIVAPQGLEIEATNFEYLQQNAHHNFRFRVYNASNNIYFNDDGVNCSMGIIDNKGEYVYQQPKVTATGYVFMVNLTGGNFSRIGFYHQGINCITDDGTTAAGVKTLSFEVTPTGDERGFGFFLVLIIASAIIFLEGYMLDQDWLIFLAGILWIITGVYTMIYGIWNLTDLYTRTIAGICCAIGIVLMSAGISNAWGGEKEN